MNFVARLSGHGLFARALRGSVLTAGSYATAQGLRLISNLILTRLLYPEAFGVMALVSVALVGLQMFSDLGLGPAIAQNPRGDDPDFLNTAFTLNALRGAVLPGSMLYSAVSQPVGSGSRIFHGGNPSSTLAVQRIVVRSA